MGGLKKKADDFILEMYRSHYEKSHNPLYVWECIYEIESDSLFKNKEYPVWIKNYLSQIAEYFITFSDQPKTDTDITATLGFKDLRQLYKPDGKKVFLALLLMDEEINDGMSREDAALEAENYLLELGLQSESEVGKRGYLGSNKLEKLYREYVQVKKDFSQENQIEGERE